MKHLTLLSVVLLVLFCSCVPPQQQEVPDENAEASYQEFYDQLSPYGHWVQNPQYGYVWIPEAGPDFVPYSSAGYWVWTDSYGWTWTSDYAWGWAPFHYGRWNFEDDYGWYWVPDYTWGPAWVAWRQCPGYYGWCPLGPGVSVEFGIGGRYDPDDWWWTACDGRYMGRREMRDHYEHGDRDRGHGDRGDHGDRGVIGRIRGGESRAVGVAAEVGGGKRGFVTGPGRQEVEAITHTPIQPVKIVSNNKPGEALANGTLSVYRPQLQAQVQRSNQGQRTVSPQTQTQQQPQQRTSAPQTQTQPREGRNSQPPQSQIAPRSVTTTRDIQDLHRQANPQSYGRTQSAPAPREQAAPRYNPPPQRAPQQSAPRGGGSEPRGGGGGGRPK